MASTIKVGPVVMFDIVFSPDLDAMLVPGEVVALLRDKMDGFESISREPGGVWRATVYEFVLRDFVPFRRKVKFTVEQYVKEKGLDCTVE